MTSIIFTGDIAFSKYFKDHWQMDFMQKEICDFFDKAQYVVANVEAPLTEATTSSTREINHFSNPGCAQWLKKISANIWSIANNHILDCGEKGMEDTIEAAKKVGAITVGAGKNIDEASKHITIDADGGIGIFAVTYKRGEFIIATKNRAGCIIFNDLKHIKKIICEIKSKNKRCIIIAHGGDEFSNLPMPYMRRLYKKFLKFGADVVVGHHPHVVQNYEKIGEKMIFYSLGNFVFDTDYQRKQKYSEYGILLKLNFDNDKISYEYLPTKVNRTTQRIEICEAPSIFCDVSKRDYNLLWTLAAKKFCENFVVAKKFVMPQTHNYNGFQWFKFHIEKIGLKNALCVYLGKFLSMIPFWRLAEKTLRTYIEQK